MPPLRHAARHRAAKQRADAGRRSRRAALSVAVGGSALLVAAVGALALGRPLPPATTHMVSMSAMAGGRVAVTDADEPRDSLDTRTLTRMSRGDGRPPLETAGALESAAETRAAARNAQLASAAVQAKTYAEDLDSLEWVLPTHGFHVSAGFGESGWYWSSGYHTGVDLASACYTPAVAVNEGAVSQAGWDGPYGYQVRLTLSNGDQVWYNHLVAIETTVGAHLSRGSLVGLVGETGNAYGCHLHFEYRLAADLDTPVDPAPFFAAHGLPLR